MTSDGRAWAWGDNLYGALGTGTSERLTSAPALISTLSGVAAVSTSETHSLALDNSGSVWAWGSNNSGQLGDGTNMDSQTPIRLNSLVGIVAVATGGYNSFALEGNGNVWAWGLGPNGQLGNGQLVDSNVPVQVRVTNATRIAAGANHVMALLPDGTISAWGRDDNGQLGDGRFFPGTANPVKVKGLALDVVSIGAGGNHSLAITGDGAVWAWGYNSKGQLGNGITGVNSNLPVQVVGLPGSGIAVSGGGLHSAAILADESLWTWGFNSSGQLGDGTFTDSNVPVRVLLDALPPDQGNSLRALKQDPDVYLTFVGAPASAWRVYADSDRTQLGSTPLTPVSDASVSFLVDVRGLPALPSSKFYRIRGLSLCSRAEGP